MMDKEIESNEVQNKLEGVVDSNTAAAVASVWALGGLTIKDIAKRVWVSIYDGDLLTRAAALSYYFLFSLFPLLLFLVSLLGYFAHRGTELRRDLLAYLARLLPRSASELIYKTLDEITTNSDGGKLSFGLLASLFVASSGIAAIGEALNVSYRVRESRPWWRVRVLAVGLTLVISVLVIFAVALVLYGGVIGEGLAERFGLGGLFLLAWHLLQWPIVLSIVLLSFALIYYFTPDLKEQKWYWITPGSVTGVALWVFVSFLFRTYLQYFDRYSVTYGSLGAVIILMLWFYLTGGAILIGGEINAEIEHAAAAQGVPEAKPAGEKSPPTQEESEVKG